jgi:hypothetical protein
MADNFVAADERNMTYAERANIRLDFHRWIPSKENQTQEVEEDVSSPADDIERSSQSTSTWYHSLYGFLKDEGLSLTLNNKFEVALNLVGGLLGQLGELTAGVTALGKAITGNQTQGYITTGFGENASIILNTPLFWQGTDPIEFSVSLFQIADKENQIIENYQRILEVLSPSTGQGAMTATLSGEGPGIIYVHYFPEVQSGTGNAAAGQGKIIFGPCLCRRVDMRIAPPYSFQFMPIVGEYTFTMVTSRILDRSQIQSLFNKQFPYPKTGTIT